MTLAWFLIGVAAGVVVTRRWYATAGQDSELSAERRSVESWVRRYTGTDFTDDEAE